MQTFGQLSRTDFDRFLKIKDVNWCQHVYTLFKNSEFLLMGFYRSENS